MLSYYLYSQDSLFIVGKSARLMIERLWVRAPAGVVEEFSSPESALCADAYSMSIPPLCFHSGRQKTSVILPKVQVAGYT